MAATNPDWRPTIHYSNMNGTGGMVTTSTLGLAWNTISDCVFKEEDSRVLGELHKVAKEKRGPIEDAIDPPKQEYVKMSFDDIKNYGYAWEKYIVEYLEKEILPYISKMLLHSNDSAGAYIAGGFLSRLAQSYFEDTKFQPFNQNKFDLDLFYTGQKDYYVTGVIDDIMQKYLRYDHKKSKPANFSLVKKQIFRSVKQNRFPNESRCFGIPTNCFGIPTKIAPCKYLALVQKRLSYNALDTMAFFFDINFKYKHVPLQVIGRKHKDVEDLLNNFDFSVSRIATDGAHIIYDANFVADMKDKKLKLGGPISPKDVFTKRLNKYRNRGFEIESQQEIKNAQNFARKRIFNPTKENIEEKFWSWFVNFNEEEFIEKVEYCY